MQPLRARAPLILFICVPSNNIFLKKKYNKSLLVLNGYIWFGAKNDVEKKMTWKRENV